MIPVDHSSSDTQIRPVDGVIGSADGQKWRDAQGVAVVGASSSTATSHTWRDTQQELAAAVELSERATYEALAPKWLLSLAQLAAAAAAYEGAQRLRRDTCGRVRSGIRESTPPEQRKALGTIPDSSLQDHPIVASLYALETVAGRELAKALKAHPLGAWGKAQRGVGTASFGRILARLGDLSRYPSPAHLWSYCGLDGPGWRYRSYCRPILPLLYVQTDSFVKNTGPWREMYDKRKAYEQERGTVCEKCAEADLSECRPGHVHNRAKRYVAKQFLLAMWREWQVVSAADGQSTPDTQRGDASAAVLPREVAKPALTSIRCVPPHEVSA